MVITITKESSGRIIVAFPYNPLLVAKIKTIEGRKRYPDKKYWTIPFKNC